MKNVVKPGSYRPTFENAGLYSEQTSAPIKTAALKDDNLYKVATGFWTSQRAAIMTGVCFIALTTVVLSTIGQYDFRTPVTNGLANDTAELAALRERSMTSVQSANIANQTRGAFFPFLDVSRQMIKTENFRHASSLDPGLPGGWSGPKEELVAPLLYNLHRDPYEKAACMSVGWEKNVGVRACRTPCAIALGDLPRLPAARTTGSKAEPRRGTNFQGRWNVSVEN